MDRAAKAVPRELRQEAGMVDMGVAEDNRVDRARVERKGPVVQLGLRTLEHALRRTSLPCSVEPGKQDPVTQRAAPWKVRRSGIGMDP